MENILINEECRIPGTDIILEAGDIIKINESEYEFEFSNHWRWPVNCSGDMDILEVPDGTKSCRIEIVESDLAKIKKVIIPKSVIKLSGRIHLDAVEEVIIPENLIFYTTPYGDGSIFELPYEKTGNLGKINGRDFSWWVNKFARPKIEDAKKFISEDMLLQNFDFIDVSYEKTKNNWHDCPMDVYYIHNRLGTPKSIRLISDYLKLHGARPISVMAWKDWNKIIGHAEDWYGYRRMDTDFLLCIPKEYVSCFRIKIKI